MNLKQYVMLVGDKFSKFSVCFFIWGKNVVKCDETKWLVYWLMINVYISLTTWITNP